MARAMHREICSMRVAEAAKRPACIDTEGLARDLAGKHGAIIGEVGEILVEALSQGGEQDRCGRRGV
jgi:hypothetical protein